VTRGIRAVKIEESRKLASAPACVLLKTKKLHNFEGRRLSRSVGGSKWSWSYTALGLVETATDANENETAYENDGWWPPSPIAPVKDE
jgi:YD repeat-containing protein